LSWRSEEVIRQKLDYYPVAIWREPVNCSVVFNGRLKTTLGRANILNNIIEISPHINSELIFDDTLIHELCHLRYPCSADGDEDFENELERIGVTSTETDFIPSDNLIKLNQDFWNNKTPAL
jgi:predicted SprT family Zn-dependent metalloprotease